MPQRRSAGWYKWATKPGHLTKAAMKAANLHPLTLHTARKTDPTRLSEKTFQKLHKAYYATQYNKLRRSGVNRQEAQALARHAAPKEVSRVAKDRRLYMDEMVMRHRAPTTEKAWRKERKKMRRYMARQKYTDSDWAEFSAWYGKTKSERLKASGGLSSTAYPLPGKRKEMMLEAAAVRAKAAERSRRLHDTSGRYQH